MDIRERVQRHQMILEKFWDHPDSLTCREICEVYDKINRNINLDDFSDHLGLSVEELKKILTN